MTKCCSLRWVRAIPSNKLPRNDHDHYLLRWPHSVYQCCSLADLFILVFGFCILLIACLAVMNVGFHSLRTSEVGPRLWSAEAAAVLRNRRKVWRNDLGSGSLVMIGRWSVSWIVVCLSEYGIQHARVRLLANWLSATSRRKYMISSHTFSYFSLRQSSLDSSDRPFYSLIFETAFIGDNENTHFGRHTRHGRVLMISSGVGWTYYSPPLRTSSGHQVESYISVLARSVTYPHTASWCFSITWQPLFRG